jgi:hypothetical protein
VYKTFFVFSLIARNLKSKRRPYRRATAGQQLHSATPPPKTDYMWQPDAQAKSRKGITVAECPMQRHKKVYEFERNYHISREPAPGLEPGTDGYTCFQMTCFDKEKIYISVYKKSKENKL